MWLYFDECCSRRFKVELTVLFAATYPDLKISHVLEHYDQGASDSTWIKSLQEERDIVIVTADLGRQGGKEKLPLLCKELEVTNVAFSNSLRKLGYPKQKDAIVAVFPQLIEQVPRLPRGTQVKLRFVVTKRGREKFDLLVDGKSISSILGE